MLKTVKISHPENDVWFVSDMHFYHDRDFVYGKRGFGSMQEHNDTLIDRWNAHLTDESIVVHLGDFCFGDPDGKRFKELVARLRFRTMYMHPGNHVSGYLAVYKEMLAKAFPSAINPDKSLSFEVYPLSCYLNGSVTKNVIFVTQYTEYSVNGHPIMACHYPIISHNHHAKASTHLTGHSHGSCPVTNKNTGKGRRLDVGIESFGRPVSLSEIKVHLRGRDLDIVDHHDGSQGAH